jgi:D-serine deaminase-like pyridoxal phosphate-dependent protein
LASELEMPDETVETPCFVLYEERVIRSLERSIEACGAGRFMPHVKTHRAAWIVDLLRKKGVEAFKAATVAEVELVAGRGAKSVTLAYTTVNPANIARFMHCAGEHPATLFVAMVDCERGVEVWRRAVENDPENIGLRVDLDSGMGRTGAPMTDAAVSLAHKLAEFGRFAGWHIYDGHVRGGRS